MDWANKHRGFKKKFGPSNALRAQRDGDYLIYTFPFFHQFEQFETPYGNLCETDIK
jgi:hypothetical protein